MRIPRSVKMGLAMGVMLVSGGCAADMLAPQPAPREAGVVETLAGEARGPTASLEARPRIRICQCGSQEVKRLPVFVDGEELLPDGLRDVDPRSIESIDVVKGPAAVLLYGPSAVDGVVLVRKIRR